jgi:ABC-2 type transport system permease protein
MGARRAALREMTLTRLRVMLREPEVVFWVFLFPVLLALGLGVAFSDPTPERVRVALVGYPGGVPAGGAGDAVGDPTLPDFVEMAPGEAATALARGTVSLVATVQGDSLVYRYDPTRPEARGALLATDRALQRAAGALPVRPVRREEVLERGGRYIDWLIPGLIGFNLMSTGLWAVGFYLTQLRATRQLKRLVATPMRRGDFLLAQMLARLVFLVAEVPLLVVFAWLAFGVTLEGSLPAFVGVVLLGGAAFSGLGLLAASRVRTVEGVSGIINVIVMPMVVLSGVFFSTARFPESIQPLIRVLPLTALNDALRAIYNEGAGLGAVGMELALVTAWGAASFLLALRLFRWQ